MMYFLDTSAVINLLKGHSDISKWLDDIDGELVSGYVCLAELYEGVFRSNNPENAEKQVLAFFRSLTKTFGIDRAVAREFGSIKTQLQKKGVVIDDIDILIGAICKSEQMTVVTYNSKHFSRIEGLEIVSW